MTSQQDFRLPPLDGDDVVVRMEREMLLRWGFLDAAKAQPTHDKDVSPAGKERDPTSDNIEVTGHTHDQKSCDIGTAGKERDPVSDNIEVTGHTHDQKSCDVGPAGKERDPVYDSLEVEVTSEVHDEKSCDIVSLIEEERKDSLILDQDGDIKSRICPPLQTNGTVMDGGNHDNDHIMNGISETQFETGDAIQLQQKDNNFTTDTNATLSTTGHVHIDSDRSEASMSATPNVETTDDRAAISVVVAKGQQSNGSDNVSKEGQSGIIVDSQANIEQKSDTDRDNLPCNNNDKKQNGDASIVVAMSEQAKVLHDKAYTAYIKKQLCESLVLVDEALELDDVGCDVDLWLLRAKVMNSMEDPRGALRCAYNVKVGERPCRLWVEGALALEKLGMLATAENWVARAMQTTCPSGDVANGSISDVMNILTVMRSRLRIERVFGPLVKDKPIRVVASPCYNRIVTVTKDVQRSQVIFQELPEVIEQSVKSHRLPACAKCAKSLIRADDVFGKDKPLNADLKKVVKKLWTKSNIVPCRSCAEVKYCSDECRQADWESGHAVFCPSDPESTSSMLYDVRRSFSDVIAADGSSWQGWWNAIFSPTFMARLWAAVMCRAKRLVDLTHKESYRSSDWLMAESPLEKYSTSTKFKTNSESIPKMFDLLASIFKRSKSMRLPISQEEFNRRYSQLASNVISFHDPVNPAVIFQEEIKKDKKLKKKSQTQVATTKAPVAEFHGLFPLICCLNHSCRPNAELTSVRVEGRPGLCVRALMDIKAGEEIVVAYLDPLLERHDRRTQLWQRYKFICQCLKCLHEGRGPEQCTNCGKTSRSGNKAKPRDKTKAESKTSDDEEESDIKTRSKEFPPQQHVKCPNSTEETEPNAHQTNEETNGETSSSSSCRPPPGDPALSVEDDGVDDDDRYNDKKRKEEKEEGKSDVKPIEGKSDVKPIEGNADVKPLEGNAKLKLSMCGRCKLAWYCCVECQKESWTAGHKKICVPR